jgi:hypothetical protein
MLVSAVLLNAKSAATALRAFKRLVNDDDDAALFQQKIFAFKCLRGAIKYTDSSFATL